VIVRIWEEAGALRCAVTDDGAGFDPAAKGTGSGFVNMRDRLGAIGGSLRVESSLGAGTSVLGVLPLAG
jgi:signal transduction histidine kinase